MAYGADSYVYRRISGPTPCTTASFSGTDPAYNVLKSSYGANGAFVYKTFTGGTPCTREAFGGSAPLYNVAKSCYLP
jgi:hypothetical protein